MAQKLQWAEKVMVIFLIIFGLYLLFQIVRKIVGGSWTAEDVILGILFFNSGAIFTIGIMLAQLRSDHNHLNSQFKSLAEDFKVVKAYIEKLEKQGR